MGTPSLGFPSKADGILATHRSLPKESRMHTRMTTCLSIGLILLGWPAGVARATDDDPVGKDRPANRLAKETSPYLLLHAHNPVDWYPWGPEAFARAKAENKPIFLSVGYSSCYWCHVMERGDFVDPEIAKACERRLRVHRGRPRRAARCRSGLYGRGSSVWSRRLADVAVPDARRHAPFSVVRIFRRAIATDRRVS